MPQQIDSETANRHGLDPDAEIFRPGGCDLCRDTGYKGRLAVFEIIRINTRLAEMIQANETVGAMKKAAIEDGMSLLQQSAMTKVASGETGLDEALSLCVNH